MEWVGEGGTSLEGKLAGEKGVRGESFQRGFFWLRSRRNEEGKMEERKREGEVGKKLVSRVQV